MRADFQKQSVQSFGSYPVRADMVKTEAANRAPFSFAMSAGLRKCLYSYLVIRIVCEIGSQRIVNGIIFLRRKTLQSVSWIGRYIDQNRVEFRWLFRTLQLLKMHSLDQVGNPFFEVFQTVQESLLPLQPV